LNFFSFIKKKLLTREDRFKKKLIERECLIYLQDISNNLHTMERTLTYIDTALTRSHTNYTTQISIELTKSSNQMNKAMKLVRFI